MGTKKIGNFEFYCDLFENWKVGITECRNPNSSNKPGTVITIPFSVLQEFVKYREEAIETERMAQDRIRGTNAEIADWIRKDENKALKFASECFATLSDDDKKTLGRKAGYEKLFAYEVMKLARRKALENGEGEIIWAARWGASESMKCEENVNRPENGTSCPACGGTGEYPSGVVYEGSVLMRPCPFCNKTCGTCILRFPKGPRKGLCSYHDEQRADNDPACEHHIARSEVISEGLRAELDALCADTGNLHSIASDHHDRLTALESMIDKVNELIDRVRYNEGSLYAAENEPDKIRKLFRRYSVDSKIKDHGAMFVRLAGIVARSLDNYEHADPHARFDDRNAALEIAEGKR